MDTTTIQVNDPTGLLAAIAERTAAPASPQTANTAPDATAPQTVAPETSATEEGLRAALAGDATTATEPSQTDTPAAAKPAGDQAPETTTTETAKAPEKPLTKYEKDAARMARNRAEFEAEKAASRAREADRVKALAEREAKLAEREAEAERSQGYTPEQYEAHMGRKLAAAQDLETEADRLENAGQFEEAKAKRAAAHEERLWAREAQRAADEARKNPPNARLAARRAQFEAQQKEWQLKAGIDFPDLAKPEAPLRQKAAEILAEFPGYETIPQSAYIAARMASAELAAARVPALTKELEQSKQRIRELELLTSPGGAGGPAHLLPGKPTAEQTREELVRLLERS